MVLRQSACIGIIIDAVLEARVRTRTHKHTELIITNENGLLTVSDSMSEVDTPTQQRQNTQSMQVYFPAKSSSACHFTTHAHLSSIARYIPSSQSNCISFDYAIIQRTAIMPDTIIVEDIIGKWNYRTR